ncbi:MAG: YhcH/YjgK/YiaL family protein [Desulfobulbaceae bacterium]|nr:YhcH/YjgK/YiaL family protein [Desulfobulbaceae bacterium]HIJ80025.1 YhcH/YjgK/YiaL family protein [Deltaproteobacteria bacterium]
MILDVLENAPRYLTLNPGFAKAFEFLQRPDLKELAVDRYEIDGERVYAMVAKEHGRKKDDALLESHVQYIDIQLVLAGVDEMGWKPKTRCKDSSGPYNQAEDIQFFADLPDAWLATRSGEFAIFFPEDAHMPLISSGVIHKVVVKIAVNHG